MNIVYELLKKVPKGKVVSYGELARAANTSPRAVGKLMNVNPYAPTVPCHRVVNKDGRIGGFASGVENKIALLKKEGVPVVGGRIDERFFFYFN
ncbi:MGMT family protein [Candidatus Micrarchaeota archaeon]|nr:MGMT family protein [Candidatus Micrarchaeota archaeon]